MSDDVTPSDDTAAVNKGEFTPITSQEELNKALAARLERERAKFADYNDLKTKASKFDELAEAQKSETQKAIERAEAAERALEATQSERLRLSVIAKHGIPEEFQDFVTGASEEELNAKAEKVKALIPAPDTNGVSRLVIPTEGGSPAPAALNSDPLLEALKSKLGI